MIMRQEKCAQYILALHNEGKNAHQSEDRATYEKLSSYVSLIIAKEILDEDNSSEIESFERLIGQSWLNNADSHARLYKLWNDYKNS